MKISFSTSQTRNGLYKVQASNYKECFRSEKMRI